MNVSETPAEPPSPWGSAGQTAVPGLSGEGESGAAARAWTVVLPPLELLSANDRSMHWGRGHRLTTMWRQAAGWAAKSLGVPRLEMAWIIAEYRMPDRRRRDVGNLYPTVKACIDGLIDAGVLIDDDWKHMPALSMQMGNVEKPGRLVLTIHDLRSGDWPEVTR